MNRPPRVLMIGRHFWPHGSIDSAAYLVRLARDLDQHDVHVEVLTPRHSAAWTAQFDFGRIRVHRPTTVPRSDWSTGRYIRHLSGWLKQNARSFDVLFADAIREEASAVIEAAKSLGSASLLRCRGWGIYSDIQWWTTHRSAARCGAIGRQADGVIAPSAAAERALIGEGYAARRIQRIAPGFWPLPNRTAAARQTARRVLASANGDLMAESDAPVLLCLCRMIPASGVNTLLPAIRHLVTRYPRLRVWLVGDGPSRDWIYQQLRGDGVRASIAMPGTFCELDDLLLAADLYLQPDDYGLDTFFTAAVSAGLPIAALTSEATRSVLAPRGEPHSIKTEETALTCIRWIDEAKPKAFKRAIVDLLNDMPQAERNAETLRRTMLRSRPQSAVIEETLSLIRTLTQQQRQTRNGPQDLAGGESRVSSLES